jgi:hypothetical protein
VEFCWGTSKYPPSTFIFESPVESQQSALIAEFGQRVNLDGTNPITYQTKTKYATVCDLMLFQSTTKMTSSLAYTFSDPLQSPDWTPPL